MSWSPLRSVVQALKEIVALILDLHRKVDIIMSEEDDLKAAIAENKQAMIDEATAITAKVDEFLAAQANRNVPSGDLENMANELRASTAQFKLAVNNALNPPQPATQNTGGAASTNTIDPNAPQGTGTDPNAPKAA